MDTYSAPHFTYETGTRTYDDRAPEHLRGTTVQTYAIVMDGRAVVHGTGTEADAQARLADMVAAHAPTTVRFANGTVVTLAKQTADRVVGLSDEGYVVMQDDHSMRIGLTDCCHASATGTEDCIACRRCYREVDPALGGPMDVAVPVVEALPSFTETQALSLDGQPNPAPFTVPPGVDPLR